MSVTTALVYRMATKPFTLRKKNLHPHTTPLTILRIFLNCKTLYNLPSLSKDKKGAFQNKEVEKKLLPRYFLTQAKYICFLSFIL